MLLPLSFLYCLIATLKRKISLQSRFSVPIISIGNLIAGGSGKTPFILHLAQYLESYQYGHIAIISRGYKRKSRGLVWVSKNGVILSNVKDSGDEPYLIASVCAQASVIVCKKRKKAIKEAISNGAKIILLDDGFRFNIDKFDIILRPKIEPFFRFCLPSGLYRESPSLYDSLKSNPKTLILQEGKDFYRFVEIINQTPKMLLVTAIANPSRLDEFLPNIIGRVEFSDHSEFDKDQIMSLMKIYEADSILTTQKDEVKLRDFGINLSIMQLFLKVKNSHLKSIHTYIKSFHLKSTLKMIYAPQQEAFIDIDDEKKIDIFMQVCPQASRIDVLEFLEYCILASFNQDESRIYELSEVWLPHKNDLQEEFSYDAEAIAMLGELFTQGMIDFYPESKKPNHTLSRSFSSRESAWKYFRNYFFYKRHIDENPLDSDIDFWDNPQTWSADNIFIARTIRGEEYFAQIAKRFYEKYKHITLESI